jgi:hypothetical protein
VTFVHVPSLSQWVIHFKVIVVSCRNRRAVFNLPASLLAAEGKKQRSQHCC